jgi:hypothetical protein
MSAFPLGAITELVDVMRAGGVPFRVEQTQIPVGSLAGGRTPPVLKVVEKRDERKAGEELLLLDEITREGAWRILIEALRAEFDDYAITASVMSMGTPWWCATVAPRRAS